MPLFQDDNPTPEEIIDTICAGCDLSARTNDVGLCRDCAAKLERDLIRNRDWDYSITAFGVASEKRETLRQHVIQEYGTKYELILPPDGSIETPRQNKHSRSRSTQRKQEIATQSQREYNADDVLQAAQVFLRDQEDDWVNFSLLAQHLYEHFYRLNPKRLGKPGNQYKSLLKFVVDYPSLFVVRQDDQNQGTYWVSLSGDHNQ